MPIATCYIPKNQLDALNLEQLVQDWSRAIPVDEKDVCITVVSEFVQAGQTYNALIHLYLPSLWSAAATQHIQNELAALIAAQLQVPVASVFVITTVVPSGQVVENGQTLFW